METCRIGYLGAVANDTHAPNRIRKLREAQGLSQKALADLINVTPSALNKIEMGTRGLDQEWMRRIARVLNCSSADLLPDEENPDRLTTEERALIERYRSASEREKVILDGLSEVVVPFKGQRNEAA
nr:helix-turn-helix transcriptional regulator [Sphingomonas oligoaromativorans]